MSGSSSTQPTPAASLLLVMATDAALRLYSQALEEAGYRVRLARSLKEVELACHSERFDLILVADALEPKVKRAIGMTIRHFLPEAPILQIGRTRPDIEGNCFVTGSSAEDVLRAIRQILRHDEIPPAAL
jgi:CheY-like chemotaxis protein